MQILPFESGLRGALSCAGAYGREDFAAIADGLDRIECGVGPEVGRLLPHCYAAQALNCHNGIICAPLEMMKYNIPDIRSEALLAEMRELLTEGKRIAQRVIVLLALPDARRRLRHFSCKFRELFTPGWLQSRRYSQAQLERVLNAAIRCARGFLAWLVEMLRCLEKTFVVDDFRPIKLSAYVRGFVIASDRREGVVVMRTQDDGIKTLLIQPTAKLAWRCIRLAMESRHPDGEVELPPNALALFRNTDNKNELKRNGLSEFAAYLHPTGRKNCFALRPYRKSGYYKD